MSNSINRNDRDGFAVGTATYGRPRQPTWADLVDERLATLPADPWSPHPLTSRGVPDAR